MQVIKYMFQPRASLWDTKMWIDAASQMFFSLSVGFTATFTYVTYADKNLDISKQGLMASFMNVGMEVLIASFIAIPVSYIAFGADKIQDVVKGSSIAFGMVSMPSIFNNIPGVDLVLLEKKIESSSISTFPTPSRGSSASLTWPRYPQ